MAGGGAPPTGQQSRKRAIVLSVAGLLLVAAAVIAGVLGSRASEQRKRSSSPTVKSSSASGEDPYHALIQANQIRLPTIDNTPATVSNGSLTAQEPSTGDASDKAAETEAGEPEAQEDTRAPWQKLVDTALGGTGGASPIAVPSWKAVGGASRGICYPQTNKELIAMASDPTRCTIIILTRTTRDPAYDISQTMNITTYKVIMGNPLAPPDLDGAKGERIFDVMPGGFLDLRSEILDRGAARAIGNLRLVTGGTIRIQPGGGFMGSGVVFREQLQTFESFRRELNEAFTQRGRVFGGHILVLGGNVQMNGCFYIGFREFGAPVINQFVMGRELLMVAGNAIQFAPWHINGNLYGLSTVIGQVICVLAGTYTWIGGGIVNEVFAQAQGAAGSVTFVAGGICIIIGIVYPTVTGAGWRHNYGQFSVGGGIFIKIGFTTASAWGVGARAWAGANYAVGGGIFRMIGAATLSINTADSQVGAGGGFFVGGGTAATMYLARYTTRIVLFNAGVGFGTWNGGGLLLNHHNPSVGIDTARSQYGIASDLAGGAGWINYINNTRINYQVARLWVGLGNTIWLGPGGGIIARHNQLSVRFKTYSTTPWSFTIDGVGFTRSGGSFPNQWIVSHKTQRPIPLNLNDPDNQPDNPPKPEEDDDDRIRTRQLMKKVRKQQEQDRPKEYGVVFADVNVDERTIDPRKLKPHKLAKAALLDPMDLQNQVKKMIKQSVSSSNTAKPWAFTSNGTDVFACNLKPGVSSDHYEGPAHAQFSDECQGETIVDLLKSAAKLADRPIPALKTLALPSLTSEDGQPNSNLLWYKVLVRCKDADKGCVQDDDLKEAIRALFKYDSSLQLSVISTAMHPVARKLATDDLMNALMPAEDPNCPAYSEMNVYFVSGDDDEYDAHMKKMDALVDNSKVLRELLEDVLDEGSEQLALCGEAVEVKKIAGAKYPPLHKMPRFDPRKLSFLGPNVLIYADDSIAPLRNLVAGQPYTVHISNFQPKTKVEVFAVRATDNKVESPIMRIDSFEEDGGVEASFTAPDATGKWFLLARQADMPVFFAFSNPFDVHSEDPHPGRRW